MFSMIGQTGAPHKKGAPHVRECRTAVRHSLACSTFKSSLGAARHSLACVLVKLDANFGKLLPNSGSCISNQVTAAKLRTVVNYNAEFAVRFVH